MIPLYHCGDCGRISTVLSSYRWKNGYWACASMKCSPPEYFTDSAYEIAEEMRKNLKEVKP